MKLDNWGDESKRLLKSITGQHSAKKRLTLIALADAAYAGQSQAAVFKNPANASKVAHYKWLEHDPAYRAAYNHLIGSDESPGVARAQFAQEEEERELAALTNIGKARRKLKLLSLSAVSALEDALESTVTISKLKGDSSDDPYALLIKVPDWQARIRAANSILDRNLETAANSKADMTTLGEKLPAVQVYIPENGRNP